MTSFSNSAQFALFHLGVPLTRTWLRKYFLNLSSDEKECKNQHDVVQRFQGRAVVCLCFTLWEVPSWPLYLLPKAKTFSSDQRQVRVLQLVFTQEGWGWGSCGWLGYSIHTLHYITVQKTQSQRHTQTCDTAVRIPNVCSTVMLTVLK